MMMDMTERPLKFMTPAERVRLFEKTVEPLRVQLVRLHANQIQPRVVIDPMGILSMEPIPLQGTLADMESHLLALIEEARGKIIGGVGA